MQRKPTQATQTSRPGAQPGQRRPGLADEQRRLQRIGVEQQLVDQSATQSQGAGSTGACCPSGSTGVQTASQTAANAQLAAALSGATQTGASNTNVPVGSAARGTTVRSRRRTASTRTRRRRTRTLRARPSIRSSRREERRRCQHRRRPAARRLPRSASRRSTSRPGTTRPRPGRTRRRRTRRTRTCPCVSSARGTAVRCRRPTLSTRTRRPATRTTQTSRRIRRSRPVAPARGVLPVRVDRHPDRQPGCVERAGGACGFEGRAEGASNTNVPIRVLSEGNDGGVRQTNSVESDASATNSNSSTQNANQNQSGGPARPRHPDRNQESKNEQAALAGSIAKQEAREEQQHPIRVLSPNGGSVVQTNSVDSDATAKNSNDADQSANQTQSAGGARGRAARPERPASRSRASRRRASTSQSACRRRSRRASNKNAPIRVLSEGTTVACGRRTASRATPRPPTGTRPTRTRRADSVGSGTGIRVLPEWRARDPGHRPGGEEPSGRGSALGGVPGGRVEREQAAPGAEPRQ